MGGCVCVLKRKCLLASSAIPSFFVLSFQGIYKFIIFLARSTIDKITKFSSQSVGFVIQMRPTISLSLFFLHKTNTHTYTLTHISMHTVNSGTCFRI